MSQESRPDVTGILPGCHRISARIRREGWPDGAGILKDRAVLAVRSEYEKKVNALLEQKFAEYLKSQLQGEKGV